MRSTLNIQHSSAADFARKLRSLAAKVEAGDITPGADFKRGDVRVQVHTPQESDIRRFARENDIPVGGRGRYSKALTEAYAAHVKAEKAAKAAERKAAREAKLAAV